MFGVRVYSYSEGTAIDIFVTDLNMDIVSTSTHWCVRHLVSGGSRHGNHKIARFSSGCGLLIGGCGF